MSSPIEDASDLAGKKLHDQDGRPIGEIKNVYGIGGEENPMWITVESSTGVAGSKLVFVPLARMKEEEDQIRVPYSIQHVEEAPEVDASDEISAQDDRKLRDYYAIDHADQELRSDNDSYASRVPDEEGQPQKL